LPPIVRSPSAEATNNVAAAPTSPHHADHFVDALAEAVVENVEAAAELHHALSIPGDDQMPEDPKYLRMSPEGIAFAKKYPFLFFFRFFYYPFAGSVFAAAQITSSKCMFEFLKLDGDDRPKAVIGMLVPLSIVLGFCQIILINKTMAVADAMIAVPAYQGLFLLVGTVNASIFFQNLPPELYKQCMFWGGCTLILVGNYVLAKRKHVLSCFKGRVEKDLEEKLEATLIKNQANISMANLNSPLSKSNSRNNMKRDLVKSP